MKFRFKEFKKLYASCFFLDPLDTLAFSPLSFLDLALAGVVDTLTVLFAVLPLAIILTTVGPGKNASTFLLIVEVLALIVSTIVPCEDT